jgi:hypothetical protein
LNLFRTVYFFETLASNRLQSHAETAVFHAAAMRKPLVDRKVYGSSLEKGGFKYDGSVPATAKSFMLEDLAFTLIAFNQKPIERPL